ncbi:hypothetical protein [Nocardia sp. bgisy134]|uniref:hypothetical protein n=1 Tax=Nocardia sp. bgisy134 TaxID=3413789 RepID=UPI003D72F2D9
MTDRPGHGIDISTRIARGGDHHVVTGRSVRPPRAMSPRRQIVTVHRVTAPEAAQATPAKSTTWPSPATKNHLACSKRRPATEDM